MTQRGALIKTRQPTIQKRMRGSRAMVRLGPGIGRRTTRLPTQSLAAAVLFLAPFVLCLTAFQYFAVASAVANSLRVYSVAGVATGGAGLENYRTVLSDDSFRHSFFLSVGFAAVKVPLQIAIGLLAALLAMRPGRLNALVRSSLFLPLVTPIVVVALMFTFLFDRDLGIVNALLDQFGLGRPGWLLTPQLAQITLLILSLWRDTGFVMLVFLAGLQAVPLRFLEAARLDGASVWQELRHVTIPLLGRSFQFAVVFATLAAFQLATPVAIMTRGGPRDATDLVGYHIYQEAFDFFDWGRTSAMSVMVLAFLLAITFLQLRLLRTRWEY